MNRRYLGQVMAAARSFDEVFYLFHNPDVRAAVTRGEIPSGWEHFTRVGRTEGRLGPIASFTSRPDRDVLRQLDQDEQMLRHQSQLLADGIRHLESVLQSKQRELEALQRLVELRRPSILDW